MGDTSSLGDRMKEYEVVSQTKLMRRTPVIIRVDGKAFHTFTRGLKRPWDDILNGSMVECARQLCAHIQGAKFAYTQSDEISILLTDWDTLQTCAWFDDKVQKMASVSASMATLFFNNAFADYVWKMADAMESGLLDKDEAELKLYADKMYKALFDSRVFNLPKEEVTNYFIWRQQDATRNAILNLAHSEFSDKEVHGKKCDELQEMLFSQKGINFDSLPTPQKRGSCIIRKEEEVNGVVRGIWVEDKEIPVFTSNRDYVECYVKEVSDGCV